MTDSNLSAPRSPGPAGRRHMGAQIQECHGRAWAPRAGAAHTGLALRGPRALTRGGSRIPRAPARSSNSARQGTARDPPGGPTRPRYPARLPPGLGVAWRGLARTARFRMRPRVQRSWPQPALPAAELGARRSPLSALSGRSRDAAGAEKARRRLGLGRAPHWLGPRVTRPAPPRPRPPAAHALPGLCVDSHLVLRCARESGLRTSGKPTQA